jgi:hypothetical protein
VNTRRPFLFLPCPLFSFDLCSPRLVFLHASRRILVGNLRTRHSDGSMTVYGWHSSTFKRAKAIPDGFQRIVHILSNSAVKASYQRPNRYKVIYCHYTPAFASSTETERSICICVCLTYECTYVGACGCWCMRVRKTGRRSAVACSYTYKWMCSGLCPRCVRVQSGVRFAVLCVSVRTANGVCWVQNFTWKFHETRFETKLQPTCKNIKHEIKVGHFSLNFL